MAAHRRGAAPAEPDPDDPGSVGRAVVHELHLMNAVLWRIRQALLVLAVVGTAGLLTAVALVAFN